MCLLLSHRGSQPAATMACCLLRWMTTDMRVPKNNIRKQVFEQILQVLQEFKRGVLPVLAFWIASLAALFLRFLRVVLVVVKLRTQMVSKVALTLVTMSRHNRAAIIL